MGKPRKLELKTDNAITRDPAQKDVSVKLFRVAPEVMLAELWLVMSGDTLVISSADGRDRIEVTRDPDAKDSLMTREAKRVVVKLTTDHVLYWVNLFADAYRQGGAGVDHIHIECRDSITKEWFDLSLYIDDVRPPISPEAMAILLK